MKGGIMAKQILLENAYEAWCCAIKYADFLSQGYATLNIKKMFISTLHNAVELFFKQIMLNNNDHRVAGVKHVDAAGEPLKSYYNSSDLNDYFSNLPTDIRKKFYSIEFKEFLEKSCNPICQYVPNEESHLPELRMLNKLRNDETHFFITDDDFLNDNEFETLFNLMIDLYPIFVKAYLFFSVEAARRGLLYIDRSDMNRTEFIRKPLRNFKYKNAVKNNGLTAWIRDISHKIRVAGFVSDPGIWTYAFQGADEEKFKDEESVELLYACVYMLSKYKILRFHYYADDNYDKEILTDAEKFVAAERSDKIYTEYSISI